MKSSFIRSQATNLRAMLHSDRSGLTTATRFLEQHGTPLPRDWAFLSVPRQEQWALAQLGQLASA